MVKTTKASLGTITRQYMTKTDGAITAVRRADGTEEEYEYNPQGR